MANNFQLISAPDAPGPVRIVRHVCLSIGLRLVKDRIAERVLDEDGATIGFRYRAGKKPGKPLGGDVPSSPVAFSRREVEAIAGFHGHSRTAHLSDHQRAERIRKGWASEDLVERSQVKLREYRRTH